MNSFTKHHLKRLRKIERKKRHRFLVALVYYYEIFSAHWHMLTLVLVVNMKKLSHHFSAAWKMYARFGARNVSGVSLYSTAAPRPQGKFRDASIRRLFRRISPELPSVSIVPILDQWIGEGETVNKSDLVTIINELRHYKRYKQALEVATTLFSRFLRVWLLWKCGEESWFFFFFFIDMFSSLDFLIKFETFHLSSYGALGELIIVDNFLLKYNQSFIFVVILDNRISDSLL